MWVGAAVWNAIPLVGGEGLKVTLIRFTPQTWATDKARLEHWFLLASICTHCSALLLQHGPSGENNARCTPQPTLTGVISLQLAISIVLSAIKLKIEEEYNIVTK